jgi:5,10-methenyltetrahydromethanopterin hydrogenase
VRKITAIYYLDFPNDSPIDSRRAASRVRIEVGNETSSIDDFESTFEVYVATAEYVDAAVRSQGFFAMPGLVVVDEFKDERVIAVLEGLAERFEEIAVAV